ncbi:hypothetical protein AN958_02394 [Leucoagaricus sp. SymC.cos]|nr:hypothetical protein AN958_02394 [Leucoagaricus sp. SymC.cos]
MFFKVLSSLVLAQLAAAQYGGGPATTAAATSAAPAPSAPPNTQGHINVNVFPNSQYVYDPANITAQVGDLITFYFPTNSEQFPHSVTQSSFAQPCTYLAANGSNSAGFDSGLQSAKIFTINITSTDPIWFHCKQIGHCGMGMVGSINAPTTGSNTHEAFVAAAKAIGSNEVQETDNGPVLSGFHAMPTGTPVDSTTKSSAVKTVAKGSLYLVAAGVLIVLI